MTSSPFLNLPQEIRDQIFEYAIVEDKYNADEVKASLNYRTKRIPISDTNRWEWEAHHKAQAPFPEYLCLMLCNRQLYKEIQEFLQRPQGDDRPPAKMVVLLEYPKLWATWTQLPESPTRTRVLDVVIKVNHLYHPAYISQGSQNAILTAVSDTLKRFIYRGPHLARRSPLKEPLRLETVRLTIATHMPLSEMKDMYGFPAQQLETLFRNFKALFHRFCRSGLPFGRIIAFDVRMEGQPWDRIPVTSNIWDEDDFLFFEYGGFNWDSGDTVVIQPDTVNW